MTNFGGSFWTPLPKYRPLNLLSAGNFYFYTVFQIYHMRGLYMFYPIFGRSFLCFWKRNTFQYGYLGVSVTIMCRNDELSWLFTKRFRDFCLICRNFCFSQYLHFHVFGSTKSVWKQPTQFIIAAHNCHTVLHNI